MIINQQKQNAMNKEEILQVILDYAKELKDNYYENSNAFGSFDADTQKAFTKLFTIEELLDRLNLDIND
jgi:hypothetical protein